MNNYWFILKDHKPLKNGLYSYQCINRRVCSFTINISETEIIQFNKDNNYKMKYNIISNIKNHNWEKKNIGKLKISKQNTTQDKIYVIVNNLIELYLKNLYLFLYKNLQN